ncbi:MAG: extracellular solute-binding protein [Eubacteriales bacterium]|nr:extracellular solute-binding protein [Eubacteriales bacterium]
MKKFMAMLLAAVMVLSLAACASGPAATGEAPAATAAAGETITLYIYQQDIDAPDAWHETMDKYMAENPNVKLELMDSQENYFATILATGDMPDIINPAMSEQARAMIDAGLIYDVSTTEVYKHLGQFYKDAETYNGVCLGIPQGAAFTCMFYNMKILNDCGWTEVPKNADEFFKCLADCAGKGYDAITFAGANTTCNFMPFECSWPEYAGVSAADYEAKFKDGTLDFNNADAAAFLDQLAKYVMPGTTANTEDDVVSAMATGEVACCIAGNWSSGNIVPAIEGVAGEGNCKCSLPPFQKAGNAAWTSVSPESTCAISAKGSEAQIKARVEFFEWLWKPENYQILAKARGIVPVTDDMTEEYIRLDAPVAAIVGDVGAAPSVSMGFNLWSNAAQDKMCTALNDVYAGNKSGADCLKEMTEAIAADHL